MTIIAAALGTEFIAVASDSFRTQMEDGQSFYTVLEDSEPKIVAVPFFKGAISWCGFSGMGNDIRSWFDTQVLDAPRARTADRFARLLALRLDKYLFDSCRAVPGISIHFALFETIDGLVIPELFHIHTFNGNYEVPNTIKVRCQRQTFFTLYGKEPAVEHRTSEFRTLVQSQLTKGPLIYNNPHPSLFSPVSRLFLNGHQYANNQAGYLLSLTVDPIRLVSHILSKGALANSYTIGGTTHGMLISRHGEISWHKYPVSS